MFSLIDYFHLLLHSPNRRIQRNRSLSSLYSRHRDAAGLGTQSLMLCLISSSYSFFIYDDANLRRVANITKFLGYSARFCDKWSFYLLVYSIILSQYITIIVIEIIFFIAIYAIYLFYNPLSAFECRSGWRSNRPCYENSSRMEIKSEA